MLSAFNFKLCGNVSSLLESRDHILLVLSVLGNVLARRTWGCGYGFLGGLGDSLVEVNHCVHIWDF